MILAASLLLYVGTCVSPSDLPTGGIYSVLFDTETGQFSHPILATSTSRPTFLVLHPKGRVLYATTDNHGCKGSGSEVPESFSISPDSGKLQPLDKQIGPNVPRVHAAVETTGRSLYMVSYQEGTIESFPLSLDGSPLKPASIIRNHGPLGPRRDRQEASHPHGVTISPDGRHLYVCDLGLDRIYCYRTDHETSRLTPEAPAFTQTPPGTGPRHLALSGDGHFLYALGELSNSVLTYACDPTTGALSLLQIVSTLPPDFTAPNTDAEIMLHPNGSFVYVSNRGHDSITTFKRDSSTGLLTWLETVPSGGAHPRHFSVSQDGSWLICANRDSNNLVSFRVNPSSGRLSACHQLAGIPKPTCILIMPSIGH